MHNDLKRSLLRAATIACPPRTSDHVTCLMLVQTELDVHAHDGEIVARVREREVERRVVVLRAHKVAKHGLGVAENVLGADKAAHRAVHTHDGGLGGQRGRGALRVGQLVAGADGAPRNVVCDRHADGGLDLLVRGAEQGACAVMFMGGADGKRLKKVKEAGGTEHRGKKRVQSVTQKLGTE